VSKHQFCRLSVSLFINQITFCDEAIFNTFAVSNINWWLIKCFYHFRAAAISVFYKQLNPGEA